MKQSLCMSLVALALLASSATAQSIAISAAPDGSLCTIPVSPGGGSGTAYIVFNPGSGGSGATSFEFAVSGWPGWTATVTANPLATAVIGEPFSTLGCVMNLPCGSGSAPVVLFTVSFLSPESPPSDIALHVVAVPAWSCPTIARCDFPDFTPACVNGLSAWLNPSGWQPPVLLAPADGAIEQPSTGVVLQWIWTVPPAASCTAAAYDPVVYFGTDPDPPLLGLASAVTTHPTGPLSSNTTYYWRIFINGGGVSSPVWHFTTGTVIATERATWQGVKSLFR